MRQRLRGEPARFSRPLPRPLWPRGERDVFVRFSKTPPTMRLLCVAALMLASPVWAQDRKDPYQQTLAKIMKKAARHQPPVLEGPGPTAATPAAMPAPKINVPLSDRFLTKRRFRNAAEFRKENAARAAAPKPTPSATPASVPPRVQQGQVVSASRSEADAKMQAWVQSLKAKQQVTPGKGKGKGLFRSGKGRGRQQQ